MKQLILLLFAFSLVFLLGACATATTPGDKRAGLVDSAHVGAVERQASRAGVRVVWVNPPRSKSEEEDERPRRRR